MHSSAGNPLLLRYWKICNNTNKPDVLAYFPYFIKPMTLRPRARPLEYLANQLAGFVFRHYGTPQVCTLKISCHQQQSTWKLYRHLHTPHPRLMYLQQLMPINANQATRFAQYTGPAAVNVTLRCWQRNFTLWTPSKTQIHEPSLVSFKHLPGSINKLMPPASSNSESTTGGHRAFLLKKPTKNKPAITSTLIYSQYL